MAAKTHPYIDTLKVGALVSIAVVLFILFLALFVGSFISSSSTATEEQVERNITQHGKLYSAHN